MDIIIDWERYETTYKGQSVTMELLPLEVEHYAVISPYIKQIDDKQEAINNTAELMGKAESIIERYVRNIQGITVNGSPITPKQLTTSTRLSFLFMNIINQLILRSLLTEEERKNLKPPSDTSLTDEDMTQT